MRDGHAAERILEQIARERSGVAWRGDEANLGATVCIDAWAFRRGIRSTIAVEKPSTVIHDLARSSLPTGA